VPLLEARIKVALAGGLVIPAHPLALNARRELDERRQRALSRYYLAAGAGGLAVGVHTTQFEIRRDDVRLLEPVLSLAADEASRAEREPPVVLVAGASGPTAQAVNEAVLARDLGYHLVLLSTGGLADASEVALLRRAEAVASVMPVFGFYLQPAVGGRKLSFDFWRQFAEIPGVEAIKIAPFDRYGTLDVVRAVCYSSRRNDIILYTGNDDTIVTDLLTRFVFEVNGERIAKGIAGGLLGHWAVWTKRAVDLLERIKRVRASATPNEYAELLSLNAAVTDCNAAFFDAANDFRGCIAGLHEVLRRQGLLEGTWCLNPHEGMSPGQLKEIDRVYRTYPELNDDAFVTANRNRWLGTA
jgi:dihydrodipicolinate synthase/N-acetylneuraminate lyase